MFCFGGEWERKFLKMAKQNVKISFLEEGIKEEWSVWSTGQANKFLDIEV